MLDFTHGRNIMIVLAQVTSTVVRIYLEQVWGYVRG